MAGPLSLSLLAPLILASSMFVDPAPRPAAVTVAGQEQKYLVGPEGAPLFVFEGDGDMQECTGECARQWPPLMVRAGEAGIGEWRPQLATQDQYQWYFRGRPVHFGRHHRAGPDGFVAPGGGGHFRALRYSGGAPAIVAPAAVGLRGLEQGYALTDAHGLTLYSLPKAHKAQDCTGLCLGNWKPMPAPELAMPVGDWTAIDRPDGIRQWAWRGRAAYSFAGDRAPGDTQGLEEPGGWQVLGVTSRDARGNGKDKTP